MYSSEYLFVQNVDALREIVGNPTEGGLFSAAGKLRILLLDPIPLVHRANRTTRLKILFDIQADPNFAPGSINVGDATFYTRIAGFLPDETKPELTSSLKLADFLKEPLIYLSGDIITVRDLIKYLANNAGAVHQDEPKTSAGKKLEQLAQTFVIGGVTSALACFHPACKIVLAACEPLYAALIAESETNKPPIPTGRWHRSNSGISSAPADDFSPPLRSSRLPAR
jgi:hypothetical protein